METGTKTSRITQPTEESLKACVDKMKKGKYPMSLSEENKAYCNFCGDGEEEAQALIAGPDVHICNKCVVQCVNTMVELTSKTYATIADTLLHVFGPEELGAKFERMKKYNKKLERACWNACQKDMNDAIEAGKKDKY